MQLDGCYLLTIRTPQLITLVTKWKMCKTGHKLIESPLKEVSTFKARSLKLEVDDWSAVGPRSLEVWSVAHLGEAFYC